MKQFFTLIVFVVLLGACNQTSKERPTNALETGRAFIIANLNGDFETASTLLLPDTANNQLFNAYKAFYNKMPAEQKQKYKSAAYQINQYSDINDSTTIINYANDYMHKPMDIKIVRVNKIWYVDFKYTYSGNAKID
jgi:hypothetical protein